MRPTGWWPTRCGLPCSKHLRRACKDQTVDPNNPAELRNLEAQAIHDSATLQAMIDSVNLYSLTVYDINIGDSQSRILLSTNPDNDDKPLPSRPNYKELLDADAIQLYRSGLWPTRRCSMWWSHSITTASPSPPCM